MNHLLAAAAGLLLAASAQAAPPIAMPAARFADHPTRCAQFSGGDGQLADSVGADYARSLAQAIAAIPGGPRAAIGELSAACAARLGEKSEEGRVAGRGAR